MSDIYAQKAQKYKYKYLKLKKQYIAEGGLWENLFKQEQKPPDTKTLAVQQPFFDMAMQFTEQLVQPVVKPVVQVAENVAKFFEPVVTPVVKFIEYVVSPVAKSVTKKDIKQIIDTIEYDFEFIGEGGFGCVISPPLQFNNTIYIKNLLNNEDLKKIFTSNEYVGKLLTCDYNEFNKEYDEFLKLDEIDKNANHRSKLIFAAYMSIEELDKKLISLLENVKNEKTKEQIEKFHNCLINPNKKIIKDSSNKNYGYIISTRVGKSLTVVLKKYNFSDNKDQIIIFFKKLKESIKDLIQKLYDKDFIHGDIKFDNMTMTLNNKGEIDDNSKICFIDFGLMQKYTDEEKIFNQSLNHQYPDILYIFYILKHKYNKTQKIKKLELITSLNNLKRPNSIQQPLLLRQTKLYKIDYSCFFHSLEDNTKYSLEEFYTKCIKPIAKNIDIYALSLFIYQLFFNIYFPINIFKYNPNTLIFLNELLINALYNNIDGPDELIIYIDAIIDSINNNNYFFIYKKIKERRNNLKPKIPFYYYYHDKYIDPNNSEKNYTQL